MAIYTPDKWVVLEISNGNETLRKVFAGWYGGFANGDSWKLNSGNEKEEEFEDRWEFTGYSGSTYVCYKSNMGMSAHMHSVLNNLINSAKIYNPESSITMIEYGILG